MAQTDIVARLQLKAEQFSSETGQRFAELKTRARSAAADIRSEFNGAFAEVQRTAQTALQLPRTTGGGLDLSRDIAQLRAQEAAAQNTAQAQRELAAAATAVAARGGESAASQRLVADAAMVAERASVQEAAAIRAKITAYEELQAELAQTVSKTRQLTAEEQNLVDAAKRSGAGFTNIGQQLGDFTVQVVSGQSAVVAFAQQFPQATFALSTMEGRAGALGRALTGPMGTAFTIALIAATPFVAKLFESADAADESAKKLQQATSAADSFGAAQQLLGSIIDLTTGKLKTQNEVLIQSIKLQAQANLLAANKKIDDLTGANDKALVAAAPGTAGQFGVGAGSVDAAARASVDARRQQAVQAQIFAKLQAAVANNQLATTNPSLYAKQVGGDLTIALGQLDQLAVNGRIAGQSLVDVKAKFNDLAKTATDKAAALQVISVAEGGAIPEELKPYQRDPKPKKPRTPRKPRDFSRSDDAAEQAITAINAEWDDQPRLIDRARIATLKLDNLTEQLSKRKLTPEVQKLLGLIDQARESIRNGMDRPFREFVEAQQESLEVGRLVLAGRDADAEALQNILRLQQQMGPLNEAQVQTAYRLAQQHQAINRLLEDQRRIVGIYENAWGGVLDQVDGVFAKIQGNAGGIVGVVQKLQRDLLSNALFGGIDREIEDYIRKMTGKQTPAEILQDQAKGAAVVLRDTVNDFVDALSDATLRIRGYDPQAARAAASVASPAIAQYFGGGGYSANDNEIVVTGKASAGEALGLVRSSKVLELAIDGWAKRMEKLGITVPETITKGLKGNLGTILEGAAFGGIGGSVFSALGGGKADKTASGIGGVLGEYGGKELGKTITKEIGGSLGKTLGGFAGPLGAIAGGIMGNVVGGLFQKTERGSAQITSVDQAAVVNGNYSAVQSDLGGLATNVQTGIRQIADALGGDLGTFAVSINKYKDSYRVDPSGGTSVGGKYGNKDGVLKFDGDPEGAVRAAIANALADGAIKGISDASQRILASGKDLETAISKAVLIEAIPKNLKKMLDPVGAAIDDLNREWKKTVAALKEGGASTEQMAQAQQLYNLQLDQVKNSTAAASATLRDFQDSLKIGSASPYSLRDQEAAALAKLQPFLDQIAQGKSIDQSAYQAAANSAIDIERQIYGSTKQFFDFLDQIQSATNKAISSIDNAVPVSPAVENPFASATATSTADTAKNTATTNALLEQLSTLTAQTNQILAQLGGGGGGGSSSFLSANRNFVQR
ncbi:hypothetical protein CA233_19165 [Sphingomonas sp. ABOLD]|uniref:Tail length tape measure protein n=1 Tax=Sphingomonas trueperi TaxID=53317 RepID=A0A7X6BEJ8_9SPHN|nr:MULTISPECIES: hypothetical protein [Sphingomonas]NJB99435.1 hypothetical protein [Sphingomonas trueperi]RSV35179.1 hypothetical protein CA234_20315 [Sphingomonas sp. ABOLE]RSV40960.1 hypothetical protein CA233_19165 [Sphingomonas sp. ABOLD]